MPAAFLFFSVAIPTYTLSNEGDHQWGVILNNWGYFRTLGLCWHVSSAVDEQLVCNLVSSDQIRWFWGYWVVRYGCCQWDQLMWSSLPISTCFPLPSCWSARYQYLGACCQNGCSCTVSCMSHIGSLITRMASTNLS